LEDTDGKTNNGTVNVIYGSAGGLTASGDEFLNQTITGEGTEVSGDQFGHSLAAGDFDDDGFVDLAVGAPFRDNHGKTDNGIVYVLYGSADGLTTSASDFFSQADTAESGDLFGWSLAAGDFDSNGWADLAVGVRGEDNGAGAVNVIYGSDSGLLRSTAEFWNQATDGIEGTAESGDQFGYSLAAGNCAKTTGPAGDLAVGVPFEDTAGNTNVGLVNVIYGSGGGLTDSGDQVWNQATDGIEGTAESGDLFGWSLANR